MDSKKLTKKTRARRSIPTVIGTGLIALDVVVADSFKSDPLLCAGGTCGNVLTALAYLDWNAFPIARLRADAASKRVTEDLRSWGVNLDFVSIGVEGSTPVVVQHIRRNKAGDPTHSFSRKCPKCGTWLPWYKAVRAADVLEIATRLPRAEVFYFDRTSKGAVELARNAKEGGSLVVFEPSSGSEPLQLAEALKSAHIVKIASDRLVGNEGILDAAQPLLVIETQGSEGLRYKFRGTARSGRWEKVPAFKYAPVIDTAGAGDWCTAGIISELGTLGIDGLAKATNKVVLAALTTGQAMAAWACQFNGARGGMYEASKEHFVASVNALRQGKSNTELINTPTKDAKLTSKKPLWCDSCLATGIPTVRNRR